MNLEESPLYHHRFSANFIAKQKIKGRTMESESDFVFLPKSGIYLVPEVI